MKIRNGFVSNSSSSSFVIVLDKQPQSVKELQEILFGARQEYPDPYSTEYWSTREVAEIVWQDINVNQRPERVRYVLESAHDLPGFPRPPWSAEFGSPQWDAYYAERSRLGKALYDELTSRKCPQFIYVVEYSDDTRLGSAMEHGSLFDNVEHYRISHH